MHTPGPWEIKHGDPNTANKIADVRGLEIFGPYAIASCGDDARLVAAAPDLLAALQMVVIEIDAQSMVRNWLSDETKAMIRYALIKAQPNNGVEPTD